MRDFGDYHILEVLYDSPSSRVLRAIDRLTGQTVVLKISLDSADARPQTPTQQQHEFALLQTLQNLHIPVVLHQLRTPHGMAYTMVDTASQSLAAWLAQEVPAHGGATPDTTPRGWLQRALQLTDALQAVHQAGYSHRDITPANIVWNMEADTLQLIDFGLAGRDTEPAATPATPATPGAVQGTLNYLAPEQTGRIGRVPDHRSDFYSLGATLYHLLCGTPPFVGNDYAEVVHAHIARTPQPACERNPAIPVALSRVLDKLLAKSPDERYQSVHGLQEDLRHCLQLLSSGQDDATFVPGAHDRAVRLSLPERLYGRDAELAQLDQAIGLAACGQRQRVRVDGAPGAGKSFLVNACRQAVLHRGGWFAQGKFDVPQYRSPYAALHPLCQQLVLHALAGTPQETQVLRQQLQHGLGSAAAELLQVLPELKPLLSNGNGHATAANSATDPSPYRIASAFQTLVRQLQLHRQPLVFFIDDLQWADHASLGLLDALLVDPDCQHVCLVVSARNGELLAGSKAQAFWQKLGQDPSGLTHIALAALPSDAIAGWLSDAMKKTTGELATLTELVLRKTGGNPFFIRQFISLANAQGVFHYQHGWQWDGAALQALTATDNVIDLTIAHLQTLPTATCALLGAAACLGNECRLVFLARANQIDVATLTERLQPALNAGAISVQDGWLHFAHDRITEALHTLYSPAQHQSWHAQWGQLLAESRSDGPRQLMDAVQQLNLGQAQLPAPWLGQLCLLNCQAAAAARSENATDLAADFYAQAARLLPADAWAQAPASTLALHIDWVEAAYLAGQYDQAKVLFAVLHQHASALDDRIRIARSEILFCQKMGQFQDAIRLSSQVLEEMGVDMPPAQAIDVPRSMAQLQRLQTQLNRVGMDQICALPPCTDSHIRNAIDILMSVAVPYWVACPHAFPYILMEAACLSLEHGSTPNTANALAFSASALCAGFQQYALGYQLGQVALDLPSSATDFHACQRLFLFHNMVRIYRDPPTAGMDELRDASQRGMEVGNRQWAAYCINHYCLRAWVAGLPLPQVQLGQTQLFPALQRMQQEDAFGLFDSVHQVVAQLQSAELNPHLLQGAYFDEAVDMPIYQQASHFAAMALATICKLVMLLVCEEWESAAVLADAHAAQLNAPSGQLQTEFGLSCAALAWLQRNDATAADRQRANTIIARLQALEQYNPTTFAPWRLLLTAVAHERDGALDLAATSYDQAIDAATAINMLHWMGLCNTLAARHWQARGHDRAAAAYVREAQHHWRSWGLTDKRFKGQDAPVRLGQLVTTHGTGSSGYTDQLDIAAVVKMNQAIAAELVLDTLLATLLRIAMENAGAEGGSLLLQVDGQLLLAAQGEAGADPRTLSPYQSGWDLPTAAIRYCAGTRLPLLVGDLQQDPTFGASGRTGALLVIPLVLQKKLLGMVCLSHRTLSGAFLPQHLALLQLLSSQMAIALDNALLYHQIVALNTELEARVQARTTDLQSANAELSHTLQTLQQAKDQLVQSEKLAALGAMVAGVAHELNTPIGNCLTVASSMAHRVQEFAIRMEQGVRRTDLQTFVDDARHGADILTRNLARAGDLVNGFKELAADPSSGPRAPFSLTTLLANTVLMLDPHLRIAACTLSTRLARDWQFDSYPQALEQVLTQLIHNALLHGFDAQHTGADLVLEAHPHGADAVTLTVHDNGKGIPEAHLKRIFEPFFTTHLGRGGSGLGLHTVHNLVTKTLGGQIRVNSAPAQGTTFTLTLPLVAPLYAG